MNARDPLLPLPSDDATQIAAFADREILRSGPVWRRASAVRKAQNGGLP